MSRRRLHHRFKAAFSTACCLSVLMMLPAAPAQAAESTSFASAVENQAYTGAEDAGISTDSALYTAKVSEYLSVFEEKSTDSAVKGRLYRGAACYVLRTEDDWCYVVSGDVCGWACSYYLVSGEEAEDLLETVNPRVATVTAGTLRVRSEADIDSDVIARVYEGDNLVVTGSSEDWWRVRLTSDTVGYISKDYSDVESGLATAVSRYEEQQMADELLIREDSEDEDLSGNASDEDTSDEEAADSSEDEENSEEEAASDEEDSEEEDSSDEEDSEEEDTSDEEDSEEEDTSDEEDSEEEDTSDEEDEESEEVQDNDSDSESEDEEDDSSDDSESGSWVSLGTFKTTAYCPCAACNGVSGAGRTASGATPSQGTTIAVDRSVIPLGSKIRIGDHVYIAQDTGVKGHTIDIFFNSHSASLDYGVEYKEVYIWKD